MPDEDLLKYFEELLKALEPVPSEPFVIDIAEKCECGSEKVGSSKHSDWCQKYEKDV